jgi:hypothetical protein
MLRRNNLHYSYFRTFLSTFSLCSTVDGFDEHTHTRAHTQSQKYTHNTISHSKSLSFLFRYLSNSLSFTYTFFPLVFFFISLSLFRYLFFCKYVYPHLKDLSQMLTTSSRIKTKIGKCTESLRRKIRKISKSMICLISLILLFQLEEIIGSNSSSTEVRL